MAGHTAKARAQNLLAVRWKFVLGRGVTLLGCWEQAEAELQVSGTSPAPAVLSPCHCTGASTNLSPLICHKTDANQTL